MKYIIFPVALISVMMVFLALNGCGGGRENGASVINETSSSGFVSSAREMPVTGGQGTGSIRGVVQKNLLSDSSCTGGNAVYVFAGRDVIPDDIDGITADPIDYVIVKFDTVSGQYQYRVSPLNPGDYTLAFTCQAGEDNPDVDNYGITFSGTQNVTVVSGREMIQHLFRSGV